MSSFQPPLYRDNIFNSSLYDYDENNTLTIYDADRRYLKLTGGIVNGYATFNSGVSINSGLKLDGELVDLSVISGVTAGTATASKALIVDSSRDITNIHYLTATNLTANGIAKVTTLLVGSSTDNTRLISALNGTGNASFSLGKANSDREQVELTYVDSATATNRKLHLGLYGANYFDTLTVRGNLTDGSVGICNVNPLYPLDLTGDFNISGQIRNGATVFMNSSGVLQVASQPNITSVGTLNALSLNGSINLNNNHNTTWNDNFIITGSASSPTNTNGIGLAFTGFTSTGRIKAYNYILSSFNNIDMNEGTIYLKDDKKVAIGHTSPAYQLDVAGDINTTGNFRVNGSIVTGISSAQATLLTATPGTASASKALITDASNNIAGINNLSISSGANNMLTLAQTNNTFLSNILFTASGATNMEFGLRGGSASNFPNYMYIYRGGYKLLMDNTGKFAIGSSAPTESLDVQSGSIKVSSGGSYKLGSSDVISASGITGTLLTASQGNITGLGTLTGLNVSGVIATSGNNRPLTMYNSGLASGQNISFVLGKSNTTDQQGEITFTYSSSANQSTISLGHYGNPQMVQLYSSGLLNVVGTADSTSSTTGILTVAGGVGVAKKLYVGTDLTVSGSIVGTLATASQPNITSLGTLSQLLVAGYTYSVLTAGVTSSSFLDKYNVQIKCNTGVIGSHNGIGFLMSNSGNTNTTPSASITSTRSGTYMGNLTFATKSTDTIGGNCTDRLVINPDGGLVATNDSYWHLEQYSTTTSGFIHQSTTATSCVPMYTEANGKTFAINLSPSGATIDTNTGVLNLGVNANPYWRIESNGYFTPFANSTNARIGVNTQTPHAPLDFGVTTINSKLISLYWSGGALDDAYCIGVDNSAIQIQGGGSVTIHSNAKGNSLGDTCLQCHTVSSSGKVSIGGTLGQMDLNILRTAGAIRIGSAESNKNCCTLQWNQVSAGSSLNYFSIDPYGTNKALVVGMGGYVLMNEIPDNGKGALHINQYATFTYASSKQYNVSTNSYSTISSSTIDLSIYCSKNIWCETIIACSSDERLKSSIMNYDISEEDYMTLKPKRYIKDNKWQVGLVAQDIVESMPEMYPDFISPVPNNQMKKESDFDPDDGFAWSLNYDRLTIVNMKIIQKLMLKIKFQQDIIDQIEEDLESIHNLTEDINQIKNHLEINDLKNLKQLNKIQML